MESLTDGKKFRSPQIRDLMLVTVFMGLSLGYFLSAYGLTEYKNYPARPMMIRLAMTHAVVCGLFFTSLFWFYECKKSHQIIFLHPGYWAIFAVGSNTVVRTAYVGMFRWIPEISLSPYANLVVLVVLVLSVFVFLIAAIKSKGLWRLPFLAQLIPTSYHLLLFIRPIQQYKAISTILSVSLGATFFIPIAIDVWRGNRRDWLHWLGISTAILVLLVWPVARQFGF